MRKKTMIFSLLVIIVVLYLFSLFFKNVSPNALFSSAEYDALSANQAELVAEALCLPKNKNVLPFMSKRITGDDVLAFSLDCLPSADTPSQYSFQINFARKEKAITRGDSFFFVFRDDDWNLESNGVLSLYDANNTEEVFDRPLLANFGGQVFSIEGYYIRNGTMTFHLEAMAANPVREVLVGYIHRPIYQNFLPGITVSDYPVALNTEIKMELISF